MTRTCQWWSPSITVFIQGTSEGICEISMKWSSASVGFASIQTCSMGMRSYYVCYIAYEPFPIWSSRRSFIAILIGGNKASFLSFDNNDHGIHAFSVIHNASFMAEDSAWLSVVDSFVYVDMNALFHQLQQQSDVVSRQRCRGKKWFWPL